MNAAPISPALADQCLFLADRLRELCTLIESIGPRPTPEQIERLRAHMQRTVDES